VAWKRREIWLISVGNTKYSQTWKSSPSAISRKRCRCWRKGTTRRNDTWLTHPRLIKNTRVYSGNDDYSHLKWRRDWQKTLPSRSEPEKLVSYFHTLHFFSLSLSLSNTQTNTNVRLLLLPIQKSRHELRASRSRARRPPSVQRISRAAVQRHERRVRFLLRFPISFLTDDTSSSIFNRARRDPMEEANRRNREQQKPQKWKHKKKREFALI